MGGTKIESPNKIVYYIDLKWRENLTLLYEKNKGVDQSAQRFYCSLSVKYSSQPCFNFCLFEHYVVGNQEDRVSRDKVQIMATQN